ncbi:MAG: MBL fold metallo-hydrolase [Planctomycetota bacterium]|nr:MAG: MBL fold metallo-hydrolase [Planctomycetota bacterium]
MTEPTTVAREVREVAPGVLHWSLHDDRIDFRSEAYAVLAPMRTVLVDPLPLSEELLDRFQNVVAIVLTSPSHQRATWRYRERFNCPVFAPRGGEGLEGKPDKEYRHDAQLPGNLWALHAPGPDPAHHVLQIERRDMGPILFLGDLLMRGDSGPLRFLPAQHQKDPARSRESLQLLLDLKPDVVCPGHGAPFPSGGAEALLEAAHSGADFGG